MKPINLHAIARVALAQYGFNFSLPPAVTNEINSLKLSNVLDHAQNGQIDLRALLWSSIDNTESLDLDQLEYCQLGSNQEIQVKIAIADVDKFVPQKSHTDTYASLNRTSVYSGIETFPMLPNALSSAISSLLPGQDRASIVIEFSVFPDGKMIPGSIYRALVANKAKLIYEEIGAWLENNSPAPLIVTNIPGLETQLKLQDTAAKRLGTLRKEQGALEFETIEAKPIIQDETVIDLVVLKKNLARCLIENFMIAANVTMASFLHKNNVPVIQRVVRTPKDWKRIMEVAASFGAKLPLIPEPKALADFLNTRKTADPERFADLSLTIVKLLGSGEYALLEPQHASYGHFGLAVMDYTHATAPNRRYVDIIIQRLLKSHLDKKPCPYTSEELTLHAALCTEKDSAANKMERFMRKAAAAVLLEGRIGQSFEGIVTGASPKGTYVRITNPPAEGRVLKNLTGFIVGEKVRVRLIGLDAYKGYIDFEGQGRVK